MHAPLRAFSGDDIAAIEIEDLVLLDGLGEGGLARGNLVDDVGIGDPENVFDRRDGDKDICAQPAMGIIQVMP
jgi:hypothetical protein